jgi:sulfatase maturation enzyme AslB (radical SAM superfamily)
MHPTAAPHTPSPERVSVEVTNRCGKGCAFCYNRSGPGGGTLWTAAELIGFCGDLAAGGVKAVSFGGGEPLQFEGVFEVLSALRGRLFRSLTTNGLPLTPGVLGRMSAAGPDKVHVSIHFPENAAEVARVIRQVGELTGAGIRSGVNLVVARGNLPAARAAAGALRSAGIGNDRIVYLPMRTADTPTPAELASVAGGSRFQSMTCLTGCARSERFCSVGWDKTVAWCSYTTARARLPDLTHRGLTAALSGLGLLFCGGTFR